MYTKVFQWTPFIIKKCLFWIYLCLLHYILCISKIKALTPSLMLWTKNSTDIGKLVREDSTEVHIDLAKLLT